MKKELIAYREPKSPESEMFRNLRTNIQFINSDKPLQTLLITSTTPGEGKSYVAANLAVTFAQTGKRVVLVDSDMRKGRQYSIFDAVPRPGMSNFLSGIVDSDFEGDKNDIVNFIQETEIKNLYLIAAGNIPPNPAELLVSPKMHKMIHELKQLCDIIIFDAPPSLIVTDSVILSRQVDSCIIVTAYSETKIENIQKVKNAIEQVGGKIAGVVINKIPVSPKKYEQSNYYGIKQSRNAKSTLVKEDSHLRRTADLINQDRSSFNVFQGKKSSGDEGRKNKSFSEAENILKQINEYAEKKEMDSDKND